MKSIFIFSIFAISSAIAQAQQTIDKVAVQVGDNIILSSDIQAQKLQALQSGLTLSKDMDCSFLEELMYQNLLINQSKIDSIEVTVEQVDAEMESRIRMIENQIGGRDKMEAFYGKTIGQIKSEFRPAVRDQLLAQEMERQITAEVTVTPREVKEFYQSIPTDSIPLINSQMSFQQIVHYPDILADDKTRAQEKLAKIRRDIVENGKSFSTQARIHSTDLGSASKGGEIKASKGMMVRPFEATVFSLKKGEVSEVFESEYGYHIVKLLERLGDDYTCQHILIAPEFSNEALEVSANLMDSCYQRLKSGAITWNEAVVLFSNDEATKQNNGIITNPITGEQTWDAEALNQVDRQIYVLTDKLQEGEFTQPNLYSNVFERKQGIRLVRLMSRTEPHRANLKQDYSLIQRAAESDKKQKVIDEWIDDKIKTTYIRVNDPFKDCDFKNAWLKQ